MAASKPSEYVSVIQSLENGWFKHFQCLDENQMKANKE